MRKSEYKKISSGPIWLKADLDMRYFLCMKRKRKKWMKTSLNRYERRRRKKYIYLGKEDGFSANKGIEIYDERKE